MEYWSKQSSYKLMIFFPFNNEKFFCMQFGLTKIYSIEEVMMHIWHVPLMPRQRKDFMR